MKFVGFMKETFFKQIINDIFMVFPGQSNIKTYNTKSIIKKNFISLTLDSPCNFLLNLNMCKEHYNKLSLFLCGSEAAHMPNEFCCTLNQLSFYFSSSSTSFVSISLQRTMNWCGYFTIHITSRNVSLPTLSY